MATQLVVSRQSLDKIKLENQQLLQRIQDKENLILQMQMEILGKKDTPKRKSKTSKTK